MRRVLAVPCSHTRNCCDVARGKFAPCAEQVFGNLPDAVRMAFAQPWQEIDAIRLAIREAST
jgi:hypothetical protein